MCSWPFFRTTINQKTRLRELASTNQVLIISALAQVIDKNPLFQALQSTAEKFIHENAIEVIRTKGWNQCVDEDPKFAETIYDEVMNSELLSVDEEINRSRMAVEKLMVRCKFSNSYDGSLPPESESGSGSPEPN